MSIRLLICGPESIVRSALHHLLASTEQIEVVGDPVTSENAVRVARETLPDVVLLEMAPESANDVETTKELTRHDLVPAVKVIVLSDHANYEAAISAFQAGARGFLLRNDVVDDLIYGVHKVAAGGAILAPSMLCRVIDQLGAVQPVAHEDPLTSLTDREREVLRLLATGLSNAEIAHALWVQEATVKSHVSRMLGKLGLRDRVQAAALAHRSGMIMSLPHRVPT